MPAIYQTHDIWGENTLAPSYVPGIARHCNVLYMPHGNEQSGLYDAAGHIIETTIDGQRFSKPYSSDKKHEHKNIAARNISSGSFLYIGTLNPHYGHFLINSMSRLWPLQSDKSFRKLKLLCHAPATKSEWEKVEFATIALRGLGVEWDDIVFLSEPTLIHEVLVPDQALVEQTLIYPVYKEMGRSIGECFWGTVNSRDEPLYVSKTKLKSGVGHIQGEDLIEAEAARQGFRIIHPETLSLPEQVEILSEHSSIAGTLGSGFHTSLFAPSNKNLFCLAPVKDINSNYLLIDQVTAANASYFVPSAVTYEYGGSFKTTCIVEDMEKVAVEFIDAVLSKKSEASDISNKRC